MPATSPSVVTGSGTETTADGGASSSVRYSSYRVRSPDCALDASQGPPPSQRLEATGACLSCSTEGYLGQPIRIHYAALGSTVLDDDFPVDTNTR